MTILHFILYFGLLGVPNSNKEKVNNYIDQYKDVAISEMNRTGIPASIKLAQALLESQYGESQLAKKANNHFGIKCGKYWKGGTHYLKDDDYKNGKLINSCFRAYNSAYESFIEHSNFLMDENKKYRYGFLFRYSSNDYESWAHGLHDAGYATDPKYPQKLIGLIESYELFKYDGISTPVAKHKKSSRSKSKKRSKKLDLSNKLEKNSDEIVESEITVEDVTKKKARKKQVNNVRLYEANYDESILSFAQRNRLNLSDIIKYNERIDDASIMIEAGEYIFIEEKKKNFEGYKKEHRVANDETMYDIAQKYGIRLKSLYAKNRIPLDAQVKPGEVVSLQGKVKLGDRPDFILIDTDNPQEHDKFLF